MGRGASHEAPWADKSLRHNETTPIPSARQGAKKLHRTLGSVTNEHLVCLESLFFQATNAAVVFSEIHRPNRHLGRRASTRFLRTNRACSMKDRGVWSVWRSRMTASTKEVACAAPKAALTLSAWQLLERVWTSEVRNKRNKQQVLHGSSRSLVLFSWRSPQFSVLQLYHALPIVRPEWSEWWTIDDKLWQSFVCESLTLGLKLHSNATP